MLEFEPGPVSPEASDDVPALDILEKESTGRLAAFDEAMDDDLGTPRALAEIFSLGREFQRVRVAGNAIPGSQKTIARLAAVRMAIMYRLALLGIDVAAGGAEVPDDVKALVCEREAARKSRDWKKADELRARLGSMGWEVEDTNKGSSVRRA
jgi:cysteinyl-tRNA synthetase